MTTKKFKAETLRELLELLECIPAEGDPLALLSNDLVGHTRWSLIYSMVFQEIGQPPNEAWKASYRRGATEIQDESPWEDEEEVSATLVRKVLKTIEVWQ